MLEALIFVVFPFCMVFAAISDMLSMTIANRVSVLLVATFAAVAPFTGMDWTTYGWHFAAGFLVLVITFAMFALGGMGGGDAKLLSATAVWMGMSMELIQYVFYGALLGECSRSSSCSTAVRPSPRSRARTSSCAISRTGRPACRMAWRWVLPD